MSAEIPPREEMIDRAFGVGGYLAQAFPGYVPRAGQVALSRAVDRSLVHKTHLLAEASTGCHVAGQGILLADGRIKRVEDVVVGDVLLGPDGGGRAVLSLARGEQETAWIRPIKGRPWRVNLDHVLTLQRTGRRPEKVRKDCKIGEIVDVTVRTWLAWAKGMKWIYKLLRVGVERFHGEEHTLPIAPYHLGMLLGDGGLSVKYGSVSICKVDMEIQDACAELASSFGLRVRTERQATSVRHYIVGDARGGRTPNPLIRTLQSLGLHPVGSGDKFVPHGYKIASRQHRLEILAGLMDTDGSQTCGGYDYVSKSERLADDVAFLARSLGLAAYVKPTQKRWQNGVGTYFRVTISGDCSIVPCRIARKRVPPRRQVKSVLHTGFAVEPTNVVERYYGFSLSGDGRYLLDDFTVTHNTGKSIAYSVPATYHAWQTNTIVVIVTANIALQEQLVTKDLPMLRKILPWPFTFSLLKGRNQFLCPDRAVQTAADEVRGLFGTEHGGTEEDRRQLKVLREWASTSMRNGIAFERGDKSDLPFEPAPHLWSLFSVNGEDCKRGHCQYRKECFANAAVTRARRATVIVTNYHMLFAHLATYLRTGMDIVLPPFETVILDEAHKATSIAQEVFGDQMTEGGLRHVLRRRLVCETCDLPVKKNTKQPCAAAEGTYCRGATSDRDKALAERLDRAAAQLFTCLGALRVDMTRYKARLTGMWTDSERERWEAALHALSDTQQLYHDDLIELQALLNANESDQDLRDRVGQASVDWERATKFCARALAASAPSLHPELVFFLEEGKKNQVVLASRLVRPRDILATALFAKHAVYPKKKEKETPSEEPPAANDNAEPSPEVYGEKPDDEEPEREAPVTVICTSATLATGRGSFEYMAEELGVERYESMIAESPFDWKSQCLFVIPPMPDPQDPGYRDAVGRTLEQIVLLAGGRTLALFTSRKGLEHAYDVLAGPCARQKIKLWKQGDLPRTALIERFKKDVTSVLLGTESFWAGVDVPGESLSVVVIDRIPFPTPDDPIMDVLSTEDPKWFWHHAVPKSLIAFKQGMGRLIRSSQCRGVVVCLDNRILTKRYGAQFLHALPAGVLTSRRLESIVEWLAPRPNPVPAPVPPAVVAGWDE